MPQQLHPKRTLFLGGPGNTDPLEWGRPQRSRRPESLHLGGWALWAPRT